MKFNLSSYKHLDNWAKLSNNIPFDDIMKYILQIVKLSTLDFVSLNDIEFMDSNLKSLDEKPKPKLSVHPVIDLR